MPAVISLSEVPQRFLDLSKWTELRAFATSDLIALTYLNAPYPARDNPGDFFWGRNGSFDEAVRCYDIGRELLSQCRRLLIERKLLATGTRPNAARKMIMPIDWANLWPMFVTSRATGPNKSFEDIEILESTPLETPDEKMLLDCMNWLRAQDPADLKQKKTTLLYRAKNDTGASLTHATFNAAYKVTLGRSRGRPRK